MEGDVPAILGERLRRARHALGSRQSDVASTARTSQSSVSRMELGDGGSVPLATWLAIAAAVGLDLGFGTHQGMSRADATARRCLRLVVELALQGGWAAWTEVDSSETLLVRPDRHEIAIVRIWDVIADVPAAIESFGHRLERERAERGPDWTVCGAVVIPSTGANRRRLTESEEAVDVAFPMLGSLWLSALRRRRPMPQRPGMIWTDQRIERLRPMLPYLDRRRRARSRDRQRAW